MRVHEALLLKWSDIRLQKKMEIETRKDKDGNEKKVEREKIIAINKKIGDRYANQGYAFPKVHIVPTPNAKTKTVDLSFQPLFSSQYHK